MLSLKLYLWCSDKLVLIYSANIHEFAGFVIKIACLKFCIVSTNLANVKNNHLFRDYENTSWFCRTLSMINLKVWNHKKHRVSCTWCTLWCRTFLYLMCLLFDHACHGLFCFFFPNKSEYFPLWRYSSWYCLFFRSWMNHGIRLIFAVFFLHWVCHYQYYSCKQVGKCFKSYESFCH